ncbi:MAG: TadE/TadG family type IV pilus assembly protein [Pseudomonadota bacterium]
MRQMPIPGVFAPIWWKKMRAFSEDKRGIAAVEFALIATPFFFLIFGLLEICVIFIMSSILEHASGEASRQIRTGQFQALNGGSPTQTDFENLICPELFGLLDCNGLEIDVQTFSDFSGAPNSSPPVDGSGDFDNSGFGFDPGGQNDIVVVRVFYQWDLIIPGLSKPLENINGNKRLLQATIAFRNEPF